VPHWRNYYNMVLEAMTSLDARLVPAFPNWFSSSVVCSLWQTQECLEKCGIVRNATVIHKSVSEGLHNDKGFKIQRCVYNILLPSLIRFSLHKYLCRKFTRWYSRELSETYARRAIYVLSVLHGHIPPCVLHAVFTTWTNAWCTDRRFQQDLRDCVLCGTCKGKDEIEHYLVCVHGLGPLRLRLRLAASPNHIARAMLLISKGADDLVLSAVALYAVRGVVHKMRAQNLRACNVQKHLWEQVRTAAMYSSTLKSKMGSLWASG